MLTLICGIPNAGKTTYSSLQYKNVVHVDELVPIHKSVTKAVHNVISNIQEEQDLCIEGVFCIARERRKLLELYDGQKICIWLNTPFEECIARENRNRGTVLIKNCYSVFEPPTYEQGWDKIIIIENGKEKILNKEE